MSRVYHTYFNAIRKDAFACAYYPFIIIHLFVYGLFKNAFNCSYYTVF